MRKKLRFLEAIIPWLAAEIILSLFVNILYLLYDLIFNLPINSELTDAANYLCFSLAVSLLGIIFFFWYRQESDGESKGSWENIISVKTISYFAILGIGGQLFLSGILGFLSTYFMDAFAIYENSMKRLFSANAIVVVLLTVLISPITEELIFRGVVLHKANKYVSFFMANLLQAALFGLYHGNLIQGIYAMLMGLMLGLLYKKYNSILAPILLHVFLNASSFLNFLLPDEIAVYVVKIILGGICTCVAVYLIKPMRQFEQ